MLEVRGSTGVVRGGWRRRRWGVEGGVCGGVVVSKSIDGSFVQEMARKSKTMAEYSSTQAQHHQRYQHQTTKVQTENQNG